MTVRTKVEVPTSFPLARLYLEDIEEIVRILLKAVENAEKKSEAIDPDPKIRVTLEIGDKVCDEAQDLPRIAKRTNELSIKAECGWTRWALLNVFTYGAIWGAGGLSDPEKLWTYHELNKVFDARRLRWRILLRSLQRPFWILTVGVIILMFSVLPLPKSMLLSSRVFLTTILLLAAGLVVALGIGSLVGINSHTTIVLRHSSERSAARQEKFWKILPSIITAICGIGATLLGLYLKHKYWP